MRRFKKIIFVTHWPFNQRDRERFDLSTFEKRGYETEYWDVSAVADPEHAESYKNSGLSFPYNYRIFNTVEDIAAGFQALTQGVLMCVLLPFKPKYNWFYQLLNRSPAEYFVTQNTTHPISVIPPPLKIKLVKYLKEPRELLAKIQFHLKIGKQSHQEPVTPKKPVFVVFGGALSPLVKHYNVDASTPLVWAHSFDFDKYFSCRAHTQTKNDYILFLDEYGPFHPDFNMDGNGQAYCTPEEYYMSLRMLFKFVESEFNLPVVIAAHPSSNYSQHPDYFEGRKVIKGNTCNLVANASFVILHVSTALGFANLFEKPMLFVSTKEFKKLNPSIHWHIERLAKVYNAPFITISTQKLEVFNKNTLTVDKKAYADYREQYIKKADSKLAAFWDIVTDYVDSLQSVKAKEHTQ